MVVAIPALLRFKSNGLIVRRTYLILGVCLGSLVLAHSVFASENAASDDHTHSVLVPSKRSLEHNELLNRLSGAPHLKDITFALPPPLSPAAADYLKTVQISITQTARHVLGLRAYQGYPIEIFVKIDDRGRIETLKFLKRSGNPYFDDLAAETVRRSAPFGPPPKGVKHGLVWHVTPKSTGMELPR